MSGMDEDQFESPTDLSDSQVQSDHDGKASAWEDMGLNTELFEGMMYMGLEKPKTVQNYALKPLIDGKNLALQAPGGTGKTMAFAIGCLQQIAASSTSGQALIVVPAREGAYGLRHRVQQLARRPNLRVATCVGDRNISEDLADLDRKPQVVIGQPGRVSDLVARGSLGDGLTMCVVDGLDEMMKIGQVDRIADIMQQCPGSVQKVCGWEDPGDEFTGVAGKLLGDDRVNISVHA